MFYAATCLSASNTFDPFQLSLQGTTFSKRISCQQAILQTYGAKCWPISVCRKATYDIKKTSIAKQQFPFDRSKNQNDQLESYFSSISLVYQPSPCFTEHSSRFSGLLDKRGTFADKKKNTKTQERQSETDIQSSRPSGKERIIHQPPGSNCLVCSAPHAVTLRYCRFFGDLANSS